MIITTTPKPDRVIKAFYSVQDYDADFQTVFHSEKAKFGYKLLDRGRGENE